MSNRANRPHDHIHAHCVTDALAAAEAVCSARGARLTPLRRRVLELVWADHAPVGAYTLLDELKAGGHSAAPPTVYRALDFLMEQGLVHRLASLNAYIGCVSPGQRHVHQHLICRACRSVTEITDQSIAAAAEAAGSRLGFCIEGQVVELSGLCAACAAKGA
jgi:Fur family zinc uptake transcriptional regulator